MSVYQELSRFAPGVETASHKSYDVPRGGNVAHYTSAHKPTLVVDEEYLEPVNTTRHIRRELAQECASLSLLHAFSLRLHQSLDIEKVLPEALTGMVEMVNAESGCLVLLDENHVPFRWLTNDERITFTADHIEEALHHGPQHQAIEQQRMVRISNSVDDQAPQLLPGHSLIILPLQTNVGISGVLTLAHKRPYAFYAYQGTILHSAARTIEQAIQNAWVIKKHEDMEAARESMLSRLVHDIRSPLTATSASFDVIQRALNTIQIDATIREFIVDSLNSGKRGLQEATDLTNDILDMKKIQSGRHVLEYEPVLLEVIFDEIHRLLYSIAVRQQIILRYQVQPRNLKLVADAHLLRRVMVNLAANALRFTPNGGTVTMKAQEAVDGNGLVIMVEDMGEGVADEDKERIFMPFTQAKGESRRGSGLGLAFCREVALAHSGRIWVEDRETGGSRFCLFLPFTPPED
jgi:signal transduction histidine kinase